jgi:hypothetical protein
MRYAWCLRFFFYQTITFWPLIHGINFFNTSIAGHRLSVSLTLTLLTSVAEPHHVDAVPGKNFDVAPAPTLLCSKPAFFQ